jgi:hypothetical protein
MREWIWRRLIAAIRTTNTPIHIDPNNQISLVRVILGLRVVLFDLAGVIQPHPIIRSLNSTGIVSQESIEWIAKTAPIAQCFRHLIHIAESFGAFCAKSIELLGS